MNKIKWKIKTTVLAFLTVAILSTILVLIVAINKFQYRYLSELQYDPVVDYTEIKGFKDAKTYRLLSNNNLTWPDIDEDWSTGFIKLNIDATILGHFIAPSVSIAVGREVLKHSFEMGSEGVRYINISNLKNSIEVGTVINITSLYTDVNLDDVSTTVFDIKVNTENERLLVLAPHPDDAEIAASGLYQYFSDKAWIATISSGDSGSNQFAKYFPDNIQASYNFKGQVRVNDSITVPLIAGVPHNQLFNLGYFDQTLKSMFENPNVPVKSINQELLNVSMYRRNILNSNNGDATWVNLVNDIVQVINRSKPTMIVLPHPLLDFHPDHQYTAIALFEALQQYDFNGRLFFYTNHAGSELYPFGSNFEPITIPLFTKENGLFSGIYSYNLRYEEQVLKLLSLESMHDLKQLPALDTQLSVFDIVKESVRNLYKISRPDTTYFRRAARPNELFYVVQKEDIEIQQKQIVKAFFDRKEEAKSKIKY